MGGETGQEHSFLHLSFFRSTLDFLKSTFLDFKSTLDFLKPAVFDNDNENLRSSAYCKATKFNRVKTKFNPVKTKFNPVEIKSKSLETQSKSLEDESSRLLDFFSTELVSFLRLSNKNLRITLHVTLLKKLFSLNQNFYLFENQRDTFLSNYILYI